MDIIGKKFGFLTVLSKIVGRNKRQSAQYLCLCDCGNYCVKSRNRLLNKNSITNCNRSKHYSFSDGVISTLQIKEMILSDNDGYDTMRDKTPKEILENSSTKEEAILKAKQHRLTGKYSLFGEYISIREAADKYNIDFNKLQNRAYKLKSLEKAILFENKKPPRFEYSGELLTLEEIINKTGTNINRKLLCDRLNREMDVEQAINKPIRYRRKFKYCGETYSISEIEKIFGIKRDTFTRRLNKGMSVEQAIETPVRDCSIKRYFVDGKHQTIKELSERYHLSCSVIRNRLANGWCIQKKKKKKKKKNN